MVIEIDITEYKTDTEIYVTAPVNIQLWKNGKNVSEYHKVQSCCLSQKSKQ